MTSPTNYRYQWNRDGTPIRGATSPDYSLQPADEGANITCTVVAGNAAGDDAATSAPTEITAAFGGRRRPG